MKITLISDTHGLHHDLKLPEADMIIHAGDFCEQGDIEEVYDFMDWYAELDYEHKILIAGNHDFIAEENPATFGRLLPPDVHYLNDSEVVINGLLFWGSPVQPDLIGWAFGRHRGHDIQAHWDLIPPETDVLITHSPPYGILDESSSGQILGCEGLLSQVSICKPLVHVFGHIHASYGEEHDGDTHFINASNMKTGVGLVNAPVIIDI